MCLGVIGSSAASLHSTLVMDSCYIFSEHLLHGKTLNREHIDTHLDSTLVMAGLQAELTKVVAWLKCCICEGGRSQHHTDVHSTAPTLFLVLYMT
jgi:hypothetical protein